MTSRHLTLLWTTVALLTLQSAAAQQSPLLQRSDRQDYEAPAPGSYTLPVVKPAPDGSVLDSKGESLQLKDLTRGRITVMSFIYTRCADATACPHATGILNELHELHELSTTDAELSKNLQLISMSFDPAVDTPERMAAYAKVSEGRKNGAPWAFLTTSSPEALQPILDAYGQAVGKKANPADPAGPLNHTLRVYLIDREGRIRNIYSSGTLDLRLVLADVRTLMMETASPKKS